jgi:diguanylate cyclase (GGDEF)-like protein
MRGGDDIAAMAKEVARLRAENARLTSALAEMEQVALRDPLTVLYNRRYFLSALADRIARVSRYGEGAAILYIDVDGLKQVNDRLGHAAGDAVLVAIAACLRSETRESDVVARIGGDEFALLIDHVDASTAEAKMRALQHSVSAAPCIHDGGSVALSATFGMATIGAQDSADALLHRADTAMYRAKLSDDALTGRPPGE